MNIKGVDLFLEYLPFIVPLAIAQLALAIFALVHVLKHPRYRFGNKAMWAVVVCCVSLLGPVAYFVFGRGE